MQKYQVTTRSVKRGVVNGTLKLDGCDVRRLTLGGQLKRMIAGSVSFAVQLLGFFYVVYLAIVSFVEQFKRVFIAVYLVRVSVD